MIRGSGLQIISSLDLILVLTHECGMVYLPGNVRQLMPEAGCNCLLVHYMGMIYWRAISVHSNLCNFL